MDSVTKLIHFALTFLKELIKSLWTRRNQPKPQPEAPESSVQPPDVEVDLAHLRERLLALHNDLRVRRLRLSPLSLDDRLCAAAQKHAEWMARNKTASHVGENGSSLEERVSREGYVIGMCSIGLAIGENIATGYSTPEEVVEAWWKSDPHRANLAYSEWEDVGFGMASYLDGTRYWVAIFGRKGDDFKTPEVLFVNSDPCVKLDYRTICNRLLSLHNGLRYKFYLPGLELDDRLVAAAQEHAEWMARTKTVSHIGEGGSPLEERARRAGYSASVTESGVALGENIVCGCFCVEEAFSSWKGSLRHCENIVHARWQDVGFGVAEDEDGRRYWIAVFGRRGSEIKTPEPVSSVVYT